MTRTWFFFIVTVTAEAAGFGCSRADAPPHQALASSSSAPAPLAGRAEVVSEADALAVRASRMNGQAAAELLVRAAGLRSRLFRTEGVLTDALEAIELYRAASQKPWPGACDAEIDRALLEGEVKADPGAEYRDLYATRLRHEREACSERASRALATLAAFAPPSSVRKALEAEVRGSGASPPEPRAATSAVVEPSVSDHPGEAPRITSIERYGGKDASRIVVLMSRPARFALGELGSDTGHGPRLFVDVEGARYLGRSTYPGAGIVLGVRAAERETSTRVVLDLAVPASHRVFYLPEPFRLVIDVLREEPADTTGRPRRVRRVTLDPGHGGNDPGARGPGGLREKDVVLDVAHRAAPLIARELGISTLLTRDSDVYVPLDERVAKANAFSSDLFVSIHCNASEAPNGRGVMTFVLDASHDEVAMGVAARENSASTAAAAELASVLGPAQGTEGLARSSRLAELLQRSAVASLSPQYPDLEDHGVKRAGFYVLAGARMPAVLFESSFISNPVEERRLDTASYRQKLADAIVNAVRAFRDGL